jgi:hypothetical protein
MPKMNYVYVAVLRNALVALALHKDVHTYDAWTQRKPNIFQISTLDGDTLSDSRSDPSTLKKGGSDTHLVRDWVGTRGKGESLSGIDPLWFSSSHFTDWTVPAHSLSIVRAIKSKRTR